MVLNNIEKQGAIQIIQQEVYRDPYHENIQQNDLILSKNNIKVLWIYLIQKYSKILCQSYVLYVCII